MTPRTLLTDLAAVLAAMVVVAVAWLPVWVVIAIRWQG